MVDHLTLGALIEALTGRHPAGLEMPIRPVIDSRTVTPSAAGDSAEPHAVFFALPGERADGHDYVADALARGAVAAVVDQDVNLDRGVILVDATQGSDLQGAGLESRIAERQVACDRHPEEGRGALPLLIRVPDVLGALQQAARWWRAKLDLRVVAVTGSVGKTTTKEVVGRVLSQRHSVVWSRASYNNEIGLPLTLLELTSETDHVVVEMGMYVRGDIRLLANIAQPDVGIVTNVAPVHAERAGSIDEIALAKRELPEALPRAPRGVAILNSDDARVVAMASHTRACVVTYGVKAEPALSPADDVSSDTPSSIPDVWAGGVQSLGLNGLRATLHHAGEAVDVEVPLLGRHSIYAVLCGAAAGLVEGLTWDEIAAGLQDLGEPLRLRVVKGTNGVTILDDTYNASPPATVAALDLLSEVSGRRVAALGDMLELGPYERDGHLRVGRRAAEVVDLLIAVGDLGALIAEGAQQAGLPEDRIHTAPDSDAAARLMPGLLQPDDIVLVKGSRGVRMEHVVEALTAAADTADAAAPRKTEPGSAPQVVSAVVASPAADMPDSAVILGLARQGSALARFFAERGTRVTVSDTRSGDALATEVAALADLTVDYALGGHPLHLLDDCEVLCPSGGVPLDIPIVQEAIRRGIRLSNDAQEFLMRCPAPVVGITGSAGKTTTTTLVGKMLEASGLTTWVGGNIGNPLINTLPEIHPSDRVVMELSSFQLDLCTRSPTVAGVLNITPNHLDRHKTMTAYIAAKRNIVAHQRVGDVAVLGYDDANARQLTSHTLATVRYFTACRGAIQAEGVAAFLRGDELVLRTEKRDLTVVTRQQVRLRGPHNILNVLAAIALADAAGATLEGIRAAIADFAGVEHRLEVVRCLNDALWVNDSIATAPERVLAALTSFDEPLVLLAGGRDKDLPWQPLAQRVVDRVRVLVLFGEAAPLIQRHVAVALRTSRGCGSGTPAVGLADGTAVPAGAPALQTVVQAADLTQAVGIAADHARPGDVVLLSPGGTSFDAFRDFAERGAAFRDLVNALPNPKDPTCD